MSANNDVMIPEFKLAKFEQPVIEFNYEELDKALDEYLEQYSNVLVTQETLADDKKLAQELNAQAKVISRARIDKTKELNAPVAAFQQQMKSLETKVLSVRAKIDEQVKVFEEVRLQEAAKTLQEALVAEFDLHGVEEQFRKAGIADLIKLTAVTATGALTAASKRAITERVSNDKALQQQTQIRLLELENVCYKNGMAAPLTEAHVKTFLFENDEVYNYSLDQLIKSELEREARAVEAHKARLEAEAKEKAEASIRLEQAQQQAEAAQAELAAQQEIQAKQNIEAVQQDAPVRKTEQAQQPEPVIHAQPEIFPAGSAVVTCTFKLTLANDTPTAAIIAKFEQMLEVAGFKTLSNISVRGA